MAPTLTTLPQEITNSIVKAVNDQHSLFQLLQVSHVFHNLTLPHLYRHVKLSYYTAYGEDTIPHGYNFTCRILNAPQAATFVRSISLVKGPDMNKKSSGVSPDSLDENIERIISSGLLKGREIQCFKAFAFYKDRDLAIAILLPFLPNLEQLRIPYGKHRAPYYTQMLERACKPDSKFPETAFRGLKQISVRNARKGKGLELEELVTLLAIPTLLKIYARTPWTIRTNDLLLTDVAGREKCNSSNVTSLSLKEIEFHACVVLFNVARCRKLETLKLVWSQGTAFWGWYHGSDPRFEVEIADLSTGLLFVSSTLETLTLEYLVVKDAGENFGYICQPPLKSLMNFPRLKHLRLGLMFVFGVQFWSFSSQSPSENETSSYAQDLAELLPPNIEKLELVRLGIENIDVLFLNIGAAMLAVAEGRFPLLRSIEVEDRMAPFQLGSMREIEGFGPGCDGSLSQRRREMVPDLKRRGKSLGVDFRYLVMEEQSQL